jgi:hypothetical protein
MQGNFGYRKRTVKPQKLSGYFGERCVKLVPREYQNFTIVHA